MKKTIQELEALAVYCPVHGREGCDDHHYGATYETSHGTDGINRPWGPTCSPDYCYWSKDEDAAEYRRLWSTRWRYMKEPS